MKQIAPIPLYESIKDVLSQARTQAYYAINSSMVLAYWDTGPLIVENEQAGQRKAAYGKAVIKNYQQNLPGILAQALANRPYEIIVSFILLFQFAPH
jgi:DUF1016 N-terminal domain